MSVLGLALRKPHRHGWWAAHVYYQKIFRLQRRLVRDDIWWNVNDWLGDRWLGPRSKDGRGHSWEFGTTNPSFSPQELPETTSLGGKDVKSGNSEERA